ncbi:hypothetical protein GCM10025794_35260 [Massilia kyonggiensis]
MVSDKLKEKAKIRRKSIYWRFYNRAQAGNPLSNLILQKLEIKLDLITGKSV